MYKNLRIICTIISALCIAAAFPVFIFFKELPGIICVVLALLFFVLMMLFKSLQETNEPATTNEPENFAEQNKENTTAEQNVVYLDGEKDIENIKTDDNEEKSEK